MRLEKILQRHKLKLPTLRNWRCGKKLARESFAEKSEGRTARPAGEKLSSLCRKIKLR